VPAGSENTPQPVVRGEFTASYILPPASTSADEDQGLRMLTIIMRSTGDKARDVLRLRRIHGIITSYPGNDRFAFQVFERGKGYRLEFPNSYAGICPEMLKRISDLIGADSVHIEPITLQ
jgi:DNA polymerase-3 subunit alpha